MFLSTEKPWPHNAWYHAAWSHEVGDTPLARTFLSEEVVMFRDADGNAVPAANGRQPRRARGTFGAELWGLL